MTTEAILGLWSRFIIIGGAITIIIFTVATVICFINKNCLGYLLLTRDKRRKQKGPLSETDSILWSSVHYDKHNHSVYMSSCTVNGTETLPIQLLEENSLEKEQPKKRDSAYSSLSENSYVSSEPLLGSITDCSFDIDLKENGKSTDGEGGSAEISFAIQYVPFSNKKDIGRLMLTVQEATKLPGRRYMGGACNPFVKIIIRKHKRPLYKKSSTIKCFHTKTIRHTKNPKYDQSFILDTSYNDLKHFVVKFVVMDEEKYGNSTPIGEAEKTLRDIKSVLCTTEKTFFNFPLSDPQYDNGEVTFALNYLPTAKRLCVTMTKADHLNFSDVVDDISEFYIFARILLLSPSGRIYRKKKTSVKGKTDKPVWNENLLFDLGTHKLENITFMLIMCVLPVDSARVESALQNGYPIKNNSQVDKREDKYLGKVVLGLMVSHEEEKSHWQDIISSPRKMVSKRHILK